MIGNYVGAHPTDVRMTTRFKENDLTEGLTGAIHETGHSLYEQVGSSAASVCHTPLLAKHHTCFLLLWAPLRSLPLATTCTSRLSLHNQLHRQSKLYFAGRRS